MFDEKAFGEMLDNREAENLFLAQYAIYSSKSCTPDLLGFMRYILFELKDAKNKAVLAESLGLINK